MVQEKIGSFSTKGATLQPAKKDKDSLAAAGASRPYSSKPIAGKYGAWGPVFKDKRNFIDMHHS